MLKGDGNIDLVFRDGLKSLEVLPPPEVWDNVRSEISSTGTGAWVFRVAAGIAAIVSLGLLAFFVGMRSSENTFNTLATGEMQEPQEVFGLLENGDRAAEVAELVRTTSNANTDASVPVTVETIRTAADRGARLSNTGPGLLADNYDLVSLDYMSSGESNFAEEDSESMEGDIILDMGYDSPVMEDESKWMLGAKISPTYLSTNLRADNEMISGQGTDESAILSYTGGLSVVYSVGSRLSLQTGIYYSSLGRRVSDINSYSGYANYADAKGAKLFGIATATGTIASTNKDIFLVDASGDRITSIASAKNFDPDKAGLSKFGSSLRQSFEYIEVPFMLSYKLIDKKIDFNILGGLSYSLLLDNEVYAVSDGSVIPIGSMEDLTGLLLSSSFGMSMNYSLNENFSLNLEPTLRYYLNSDGTLSASNKPFAFGIFSGVYYKF